MKMMLKKGIVTTLIVLVAVMMFCSVMSFAAEDYSSMITSIDTAGDSSTASDSAQSIVGAILNVAKVVAVGIALIMLVVLAMKYMSAAPGDKAEIKKHAVVYVVGACVLFGSAGILAIIENFASTNLNQ